MKFRNIDGNYYCNGAFGRFLEELAKRYISVFLLVPVVQVNKGAIPIDHKIQANNVKILELPFYSSYLSGLKNSFKIKNSIKNYSQIWDSVVYIRHPTPFTKYVYRLAKRKKLRVCLHIVGDTRSVLMDGTKYRGLIKYLAILFLSLQERSFKTMITKTPTLVNGNGLRRLYEVAMENVREIRSSSYTREEINYVVKNIDIKNIKVLYVGYLRHEKGLEYLIDSLNILLKKKYKINLTIVGDGEKRKELEALVNLKGLNNHVKFTGHIPLGDKLLSLYRVSDIFVLPSISEGTPRVLLEAMCSGVPVIATNVGGIPFTIDDGENGLLVHSKDSVAIAEAISRLIVDEKLRRKLIDNGIRFAESNSIEAHVDEVFKFINNI